MGAGASVPPEALEQMSMVLDSAIQQMAGQTPPEALQVFKKLVSAMEQQADKPASDTSAAASGSSKKSLKGIKEWQMKLL